MPAPLYLTEQGSALNREGRRLIVSKQGETLAKVALIQVSQVIVFGNVSITTPALQLLLQENVETVLLSSAGRFYGRLVGPKSAHGSLRVAQVMRSQDTSFALALARRIVSGKIHNMRIILQRYARRQDDETLRDNVEALAGLLDGCERCQTINSLSGMEGRATAIYFGAWKSLLKPPWRFDTRNRRPPTDPVNVLLSFGYTLLSQNVLSAVLTSGMDPQVGFLHQLDYNRPSLALDLMEEFRPIIVDSVVLRCLNNDILTPADFRPGEEGEYPLVLEQEGMKRFIRELESRFEQTIKHPDTGNSLTYRRLFLEQAYQVARILREVQPGHSYQPHLVR
jgi:CRISPR-associated protein Cas1